MIRNPAIDYAAARVRSGDDTESWKFVTGVGDRGAGTVDYDTFPALGRHETIPVPNLVVVVPVELYGEQFGNVRSILKLLHKARAGKGCTEVILWFNTLGTAKDTDSKDPEVLKQQQEDYGKQLAAPMVYDLWLERLAPMSVSPDFRVRTTLAWRLPGHNFNNIRSDYMDALVHEPRFKNLPDEQMPAVAWIDANSPFLVAEALDRAEAAARAKLGYIIKMNLQLTSVRRSVFPIVNLPEAERVAMVYSLLRRNLEWNLTPTADRGYNEEPGMVMLLSTYRDSRGIATTDPNVGESRSLVERVERNLDCSVIPSVYYLQTAQVGKSNRRFVWLAERYKAYALAGSEEGDDYESFTTLINRNSLPRTDPITLGEVLEMVRRMIEAQYGRTSTGLTTAQAKRMIQIIHRCGFASGEYLLAA